MQGYPLRVPEDLYRQLKQQAERRGISINALILNAIWDFIKKG